ncbi:MAG TPA: helix-turn-helix domain-containing protein [Actinoallomurus sp.]|jgi:hypothetical protein
MKSTPGNGNATEKVLAVLQALADNERIADISGTTGLPKSTVHRILQSLVEHRFALNAGRPARHTTSGTRTGGVMPVAAPSIETACSWRSRGAPV